MSASHGQASPSTSESLGPGTLPSIQQAHNQKVLEGRREERRKEGRMGKGRTGQSLEGSSVTGPVFLILIHSPESPLVNLLKG